MPDRIGEFLVAGLILLLIPGPAVVFISARSIDQGRWAGVLSAWGVEVGNLVIACATAAGLSAVLVSSAVVFSVVKYVGAAYLIGLGLRRLFDRRPRPEHAPGGPRSRRRVFTQGLLVGVSNPKTALFFAAFLPQFVDRSHGRVWLQLLVLGLLFVAIGLVTDTGYALASGTIGGRLKQRKGTFAAGRYLSGVTYLGLGVAAALSGHGRAHSGAAPLRRPATP